MVDSFNIALKLITVLCEDKCSSIPFEAHLSINAYGSGVTCETKEN